MLCYVTDHFMAHESHDVEGLLIRMTIHAGKATATATATIYLVISKRGNSRAKP